MAGLELKATIIRQLRQSLARARARLAELPVNITCPQDQDNIAGLLRSVDEQARALFAHDPAKQAFWADQLRNAEAAAGTSGRRFGQRYCDETIVFALALSARAGKKVYEDLREWICLPSLRHLDSKRPASREGVNPETLRTMRSIAVKRGMAGVSVGCLSFDSCKIKSGLVWNAHEGRLIGLAGDAFNPDLILSQFKVCTDPVTV